MIDSALAKRGTLRQIWLAGGVAAAALCAALPAQAQQYGSGTNVIVDYGALDQVGTPPPPAQNMGTPAPAVVTNPPAGYGTALQPYGTPQAQPAMPVQTVNPNGGALLPPPSTMPVSRLTVPYKPSPSVVDGSAPAPASMASSVTPPPPPKPAPTMPAPALKPAQPETKVVVVPTPPPAPQPPPAPVPKPEMPETIAEQVPATPAAPAASTPVGTSKDNGATVSTKLPEPSPSTTMPAAPAVETAAATTTAASGNATKTMTAAETTATETAAATATETAAATETVAATTTTTATSAAATAGAAAATTATAAETSSTVAQNQTTETAPATTPAAPAETAAPASDTSQNAAAPGDQPTAAPAQDKTEILFAEGSAELAPEAAQQLDGIAQKLDQNQGLRLQLMAYASGSEDTASRARRISLSRALAVRAYLIDKGVRSTRMDVRALGNKVEGDPADRVDIVTLTP